MRRNAIVGEMEGLLVDGDAGFVGVNQLNPGLGEVAEARNARFVTTEEGEECQPRLGVAKLPWTNRVTGSSTTAQPFGRVYGAGEFRDADGLRWIIIAADGKVFRTRENAGATELTLPAGTLITGTVSFEQTVNGLVLFRGKDLPELLMVTLDGGFIPWALGTNPISGAGTENPTDGTVAIPNAASGEWIGNRLFVPYETSTEKDLVAVSDYLNATRYVPQRSQGRINQGSSDRLLRVFKFNENAAICFKEQSVYVLSGITGDLAAMALDELTKVYGLAGRKAVAHTGKDVWYLARKVGVASVQLTSNGKFQGVDLPVSATLQRVIERIDWRNAGNATMAYWNNRLYCAVPLDDSKGTGIDLVNGLSTNGGGLAALFLVPGATYRWVKGNATACDFGDGNQTEDGDYVASSPLVALTGPPSTVMTGTIERVYEAVNNAVIVYDFIKQRWAGYDDGPAMMVVDWVKGTYLGQERLFAITADGFLNLLEELYFDEVAREGTTVVSSIVSLVSGVQSLAVTPGELYAFVVRTATDGLQVTNGPQVLTVGDGITLNGLGLTGMFLAYTATIEIRATLTAVGHTFNLVKLTYTLDTGFVDFEVLTRPYRCQVDRWKRFQRVRPELRTWYPSWSLSAVTEGMREETTVKGPVTLDPAVYEKPFGRANWDRTNVNDDHAQPYRQDYSIVIGDTTTPSGSILSGLLYFVEDLTGAASIVYNGNTINAPGTFVGVAGVATFTVGSGTPLVYGPGNYIYAGATGFEPDTHQEWNRPVKLPALVRGRQVQFRLANDQGRCALVALSVEGVLGERKMGAYV